MKKLILTLCAGLALFSSNSLQAFDAALEKGIYPILADSLLSNAQRSVSVYDITAQKPLFRYNDDVLFKPASNLKLFTSAAALELLGPSYRFKTRFHYRGQIDGKKLYGDLVIAGGGDPLISGRFRSSITEVLEFWADSLKAKGIEEIEGDIVIDNSFFSGPNLGAGWSWDDLTYWYACPLSALSFNDNCVDLKFLPGDTVGAPAIIQCDPNIGYITIHNNTYTLAAESSFTIGYYRTPNTNNVVFFGGISISDTTGNIDYVSINKPEMFAAIVFDSVLAGKGILVKGRVTLPGDMDISRRRGYLGSNLTPLFIWQSDTLGMMIKVINTNSQNFFAEQTLLTLGAEKGNEGSFPAGLSVSGAFFKGIGIDDDDLSMYDGSGLSYINAVKPSAVIELLTYMANSPNYDLYYESLGNPAVDRSVRKRLDGMNGRERVRAKSGHIAGVNTFSGYVLE